MKIFLSYGHDHNQALVDMIRRDLQKDENGKHDVWIDDSELGDSHPYTRAVSNILEQLNG